MTVKRRGPVSGRYNGKAALLPVLAFFLCTTLAQANPVVRISTTYGDFSVELFEQQTPATVQNFMNYVNRGDYEATFFHRLESDFVLQGGGYRFVPFHGPVSIPQDPSVENEPGISNTRGTLAMAKLGDEPDSATSQWFVNLGDNAENLDEQNGGFTVFGQVLGDGMEVVDRIAEIETFNLGGFAQSIPLRDYNRSADGFPVDHHFIKKNPVPVERFSNALHVYEYATGRLITSVDGGEERGRFSLNMRIVADDPDVIFELNARSAIELAVNPDGIATYSEDDGELVIPEIELNDHGDVRVITDAVFRLVDPDAETMRFVLESYQEP